MKIYTYVFNKYRQGSLFEATDPKQASYMTAGSFTNTKEI